MRYVKRLFPCILLLSLLALTGCGGSSAGSDTTASDQFSNGTADTGGGNTIFGNISSATGKTGISITTDRSTVDVNNGQVLVTAKVIKNSAAVSGVPVTFSIVAPLNGPATIEAGRLTVSTDSNGEAITRITTGNTLSTTNVIVSATATIGTQLAAANTTFQIVRGTGVITFVTSKGATDPDGTLNTLDKTFDPEMAGIPFTFMQQVPFKVTDSNGNPRVGVPVTLTIENQVTNNASVRIVDSEFVTDSKGEGIFNIGVTMTAPNPGFLSADSVIYKAATADNQPLIAYGGFVISLSTSKIQPLTITPSSSAFLAADIVGAMRTFSVSGGIQPYTVVSGNPSLVTATISGGTVTATLNDSTAWGGVVTLTVKDKVGTGQQTATVSITRQ